jgi:uncharacterized membrane protein
MDSKKIGLTFIGIAVVLFFLVFYMTQTIMDLRLELHKDCNLPAEACPYKSSVPTESVAAFVFVIAIGIFGLFLTITAKQTERIAHQQKLKLNESIKTLQDDEKKVLRIINEGEGFILQGDLIEKSGYSKVKVSRILDRLEAKNLVERRRRGMSNVILLKHS